MSRFNVKTCEFKTGRMLHFRCYNIVRSRWISALIPRSEETFQESVGRQDQSLAARLSPDLHTTHAS